MLSINTKDIGNTNLTNLDTIISNKDLADNQVDLKLDYRSLPAYDKKLLKNLVKTDQINKRVVKMAVIEATSAHPPFFNISQAKLSIGSVTFLPSPGRKTLKSFRKDNSKLSPRA